MKASSHEGRPSRPVHGTLPTPCQRPTSLVDSGCSHLWEKVSERCDCDDALVVTFRCAFCGAEAEKWFFWDEEEDDD